MPHLSSECSVYLGSETASMLVLHLRDEKDALALALVRP